MSDGTPFLRVAADRIGAPGSPAKMPFRATKAANWSSIIRIGAKMAVIRTRIASRAISSHTQRAGRVPYGESRLKNAFLMDLHGYFADRPVDKKGVNTRTVKPRMKRVADRTLSPDVVKEVLIEGACERNCP